MLFGGVLTKYLGWEWIFWVNVPVGVSVLVLTPFYVRESRREDVVHDYDPLGAILVTAGLVGLVYAISQAPDVGWAAFRTIAVLVLSGALIVGFVLWESHARAPLMPLSIFRNRLLSAANFVSLLQSGGVYGSFLLLTLYMQDVLHLSVLQTGVAFLATAGTAVAAAGPAQILCTRIGVKPVLLIGLSLLVGGMLWYTQISPDGSYFVDLFPGFVAVGIGLPFSFIPLTIAALAGVKDDDAGLASGLPRPLSRSAVRSGSQLSPRSRLPMRRRCSKLERINATPIRAASRGASGRSRDLGGRARLGDSPDSRTGGSGAGSGRAGRLDG